MSHWCPEIFRVHHPELQYKKPATSESVSECCHHPYGDYMGVFSIFINHVYLIKKTHTHTHTHTYILYTRSIGFSAAKIGSLQAIWVNKNFMRRWTNCPELKHFTAPSTSRLYPSKTQPHLYIVQHMCYTNMLQKYSVKYHQWCRCKPIWCIFTNHLITARFSSSFGNSHPRTAGTCARWQQNTMFS